MIDRLSRDRGILLLSSLALMVVVLLLVGAMLKASKGGLARSTHFRDGVRAEQAAKGGLNELLAVLEQDKGYIMPLSGDLGGATYEIHFDDKKPYYSVNNLNSSSVSAIASYQGYQVAPRSADLVVVGRCRGARRVFRVVVRQGPPSLRAINAVGRVSLSGDVKIGGVKSLLIPPGGTEVESAPGGILSKFKTVNVSEPAIGWDGNGNFDLSTGSVLETAPPASGLHSVSANLLSHHLIDHGAGQEIPDIDVTAKVNEGMSAPALAAGGGILGGYVNVVDKRSVAGDLTVNGDLQLHGGTLYVKGDLKVNGSIEGTGSIFVSGDTTVRGGNAFVQVGQQAGIALMTGGEVTLEGLDASGYLNALFAPGSTEAAALEALHLSLSGNQAHSGAALWWDSVHLSKHANALPAPGDPYWVSPIAGPDGSYNSGRATGLIPAVILAVKATPSYASGQPNALKVVRALEGMQFFFRQNSERVRGGVSTTDGAGPVTRSGDSLELLSDYTLRLAGTADPVTLADMRSIQATEYYTGTNFLKEVLVAGDDPSHPMEGSVFFDDSGLEPKFWSYDHLIQAGHYQEAIARRDSYFANNPIDFSWLGRSAFQGVVYARGGVRSVGSFEVVGAVVSLGDVKLDGGSRLIFNEEYQDLIGEGLPVGVMHIEEL